MSSVIVLFFQQVYDEIEICPLNVYNIHLTKTENISDFGKLSGIFILPVAYFVFSGLFCLWEQVETSLIAQKSESPKNARHYNKEPNWLFYTGKCIFYVWEGSWPNNSSMKSSEDECPLPGLIQSISGHGQGLPFSFLVVGSSLGTVSRSYPLVQILTGLFIRGRRLCLGIIKYLAMIPS